MRTISLRYFKLQLVVLASALLMVITGAATSNLVSAKPTICQQIHSRHLRIQQNLHASEVLVDCGVIRGTWGRAKQPHSWPLARASTFSGPEVNIVTGADTYPRLTQAESSVWSHGNTIVVNFNDARGDTETPPNYSGVSISHDGGLTFTRLGPPSPLHGLGANYGDPILVYNARLEKWFAGDLLGGCGAQGIGLWTSSTGDSWTAGGCVHIGSSDDRESMWADNNPNSPFYGRMYVSFNDFAASGAIKVTHSDDGITWTTPVTLFSSFRRNVQLTGSPGSDGAVFSAALDENGGGFQNKGQRNYMYRSLDGGVTWTVSVMGSTFEIPGAAGCRAEGSYFPAIPPIWTQTGYGQPAVGPNGVVHYVYAAFSTTLASDVANIMYVRSTDNGATWSTPVRLNADSTAKPQWMPSLRVTPSGVVEATWYDQRNTKPTEADYRYQRFARFSSNNGLTWGSEEPVTSLLPAPRQLDPNFKPCWAGDYNYTTATSERLFDTWMDSRVLYKESSAFPTQKVFFRAAIP